MDDKRIIELLFERSEEGIDELREKYGRAMYGVSYNILGSREDAEECVNDAYLSLWNLIPPERPSPLYAYACRIVRNISLTRLKHKTQAKRDGDDISLNEIAELIPSDASVSDEFERAEITKCLNEWLETLPRDNLYIFMRKYWYMEKAERIAKALRISESAVYLRLDRMKKSLRKYLFERGIIV